MEDKDNGIDIIGIIELLWSKRKRLLLNCIWGGLLAIAIAYSIPKEYTSEVILAPELSSSSTLGNIGSLASLAGVDLDLSEGGDALYPDLYPQIVESTPFLCDLMDMEVTGVYKRDTITVSLYKYMQSCQRVPWWEWILGTPGRIKARIQSTPSDNVVPTASTDSKTLSRRQQLTLKALNKKIKIDVDKGTSVITLDITMQDPHIAADVAQKVSDNLQKYISDYRTAKSRKDLESLEKIYNQAKDKYFAVQQEYAAYSDSHQNITKMRYQIELDRLSDEKDLAFSVYEQLASQLEMSRARVQETTPVSVTVQPPVVPFKASSPRKMIMGLLYVFLAFFGTAAWYILKEYSSNR